MNAALLFILFAVALIAFGFIDINIGDEIDWKLVGLGAAAAFIAIFLWKPSIAMQARSKLQELVGGKGNLLRLLARPAARAARAVIAAVVAVAAPARP